MIRAGIIGLGEIGQYHLPALRAARGAELVAVCDLDRALAERSAAGACAAYDDLETMLSGAALDLLDVCLPHHLHRPVALRAIEAGCHVLLEKPMAISVAECDEITAAAERAGRLVAVSHNQLHYEPHRRLAELIERGVLGELRMLRARLAIGGRYGTWRSDPAKAGGGLLIDAGAHRLYLLRALGGPVHAAGPGWTIPRGGAGTTRSVRPCEPRSRRSRAASVRRRGRSRGGRSWRSWRPRMVRRVPASASCWAVEPGR